jgi:hypothetical protein
MRTALEPRRDATTIVAARLVESITHRLSLSPDLRLPAQITARKSAGLALGRLGSRRYIIPDCRQPENGPEYRSSP